MSFEKLRYSNRFGLWSLIGRIIALDDSHDFGKVDHLHHWILGVAITTGAELLNFAAILRELKAQAETGEPQHGR